MDKVYENYNYENLNPVFGKKLGERATNYVVNCLKKTRKIIRTFLELKRKILI